MLCRALTLGAVVIAGPVLAETERQDGLDWRGLQPTLSLANGNLTVRPVTRLDLDAGFYFGQDTEELANGGNVRRARLGLRGTLLHDLEYDFSWEFEPSTPRGPSDGGRVHELQVAYTGLPGATFRVGEFTLLHTLDASGGSSARPFMDGPSIVNLATSLASGSRLAAGVELHQESWLASIYLSDGEISSLHDDRERGLAARGAWLVLDKYLKLQAGLDGAYQWRPGPDGFESVELRDYPELRIDAERFLDTGPIPADSAWTLGLEVSGMIGKLYFAAEYYHIGLEARDDARGFDGWYAALAYPLMGEPRSRNASEAAWSRPRAADFDPAAGQWGALELAARYSVADLNDGPIRGGRQAVWTAALNYYPTSELRVTAQYQYGNVELEAGDRQFQAVGFRLSFDL